MNKVTSYLQGHLDGELMLRVDARDAVAFDGSVLVQRPELVVYPRTAQDIRKIARFAWQLAQKGHALPLTARGHGTDPTGGAIGRGVSVITPIHMHELCEYDSKQKLLRVHAGASVQSVQNALRLHGTAIPSLANDIFGTIGGAVATDSAEYLAGKYGGITEGVDQLEIVLDNGDLIQTGRKSKRDAAKLRGLQTREGEIYRGIDAILEEHAELIKQLRRDGVVDRSGYPGIVDVAGKNGTIDLTPLFVGSQGTLGIITELILKAEYASAQIGLTVAAFSNPEQARDAVDALRKLKPALLEYADPAFMRAALDQGKRFDWISKEGVLAQALVAVGFDDFNEKSRTKQLKKSLKVLSKFECETLTSLEADPSVVQAVRQTMSYAKEPTHHSDSASPALVPACYVPSDRFEEFSNDLAQLAQKLHTELPLHGSILTGIYTIRPMLSFAKTGDRQKILKIIDQVNALLVKHDGTLVAAGGEGRTLARFARSSWSAEYAQMMQQIKTLFDPHGLLNPGVKANVELRELVMQLRSEHTIIHPGRAGML